MPAALETPVVFIVFNRPDLTARVVERLRQVRPRHLHVVADGPRPGRAGEAEACAETRALIERGVDWPCEIFHDYSDVNLGCRRRVSSGITGAFARHERAIILEDDCVPNDSFFPFMEHALATYADRPEVMHVSGTQLLPVPKVFVGDYYLGSFPYIWGWATWRRAWARYPAEFPVLDETALREHLRIGRGTARELLRQFARVPRGELDSWGFQWTATVFAHRGRCVNPARNLVSNVGFGERATHTRDATSGYGEYPVSEFAFPLRPPADETLRADFDAPHLARFFRRRGFWGRLKKSACKRLGLRYF